MFEVKRLGNIAPSFRAIDREVERKTPISGDFLRVTQEDQNRTYTNNHSFKNYQDLLDMLYIMTHVKGMHNDEVNVFRRTLPDRYKDLMLDVVDRDNEGIWNFVSDVDFIRIHETISEIITTEYTVTF